MVNAYLVLAAVLGFALVATAGYFGAKKIRRHIQQRKGREYDPKGTPEPQMVLIVVSSLSPFCSRRIDRARAKQDEKEKERTEVVPEGPSMVEIDDFEALGDLR